ncbi:inverse autotransporter beta domain-containing protein [Xenorhabdus thailandensis]|uniref:inverse autotransporter beta domain-containing protein n=1 Tax=Xenorhabdus thailandensis TaxID=3136255 RepID=UPI0030F45875
MSSYTRKIIGFFIFFYVLFMPSTVSNALAETNVKTDDKLYTHLKKNDTSDLNAPHVIISNIQKASHILSSSPSELAKQAKSYALGKFNSTLSSETQKWLSQFGTARINLGLDRKWTLKDNSLDILLPLYDNKADWLFFSQLGYRNKDSRNTMNLGLGGRYFYQNWMYGLNTFYDHDFTGKNQRLGLGGEIWGDYIKLSANTYYRLSDWQKSRNFQDYYERSANGYDINGEFFLPAYPNLGMKLTYEQYFGDKVTLFNRDTKQKNPSLAKFGLTYTPIPLITMGVDYKQGESGHTETQFLANLNYKFGVPFSIQLSPANVASMRTLASSRYDLVERNNHIVLDHAKREQEILIALEPIVGYGHQEIPVNLPVPSNIDIKKIRWIVADKAFLHNKGKLSSDSGKNIVITLPSYQETHKNDYLLDILLEYTVDGQEKTKPIQIPMKVLPFMIEGKVNIIPPKSPVETGEKENGYTFDTPIITYAGSPSGKFVKNARIDKVVWTTEPALGAGSGLKFIWNNQPARTNEKGELTDEKGKLVHNILLSEKPHEKVDIYIQLDGAPQQKIGSVTFNKKQPHYKIKDGLTVKPKGPLTVGDGKFYTFKATVIDSQKNIDSQKYKVISQPIDGVIWQAKDDKGQDVKLTTQKTETNEHGELIATLDSSVPLNGVKVSLAIEHHAAVTSDPPVSVLIKPESINVICKADGELPVLVTETYTCTATVTDVGGQGVSDKTVNWQVKDNINLKLIPSSEKTNSDGKVTATLRSPIEASNIVVIASVAGQSSQGESKDKINFSWPEITIDTKSKNHDVTIGGQEKYSLTARVWREKNKTTYKGQDIKFRWSKPQNQDGTEAIGVTLSPSTDSSQSVTPNDGKLQVNVASSKAQKVKVCIDIDGRKPAAPTCSDMMNFVEPPPEFDISWVKVTNFDENNPLQGNGTDEYHYKALIVKKGTTDPLSGYTFEGIQWTHDHDKIEDAKFPKPEAYSPTGGDKFTSDASGYIYAKLKSFVGVDNVKITLKIPHLNSNSTKNIISKDSKENVDFAPVAQPAILYIYNTITDEHRYFDNIGGKLHPNHIAPIFRGELRKSTNSGPFDKNKNEIVYGIKDANSPIYGDGMLFFGADNSGPIQFMALGSATITVIITNKQTGEIQLYEYKMSATKLLTPFNNLVYQNINGNIQCNSNPSFPGIASHIFSDKQVSDHTNIYSLYNEFGNLYKWGIFGNTSGMDKNKATIVVQNTRAGNQSKYRIYDFNSNTFDKYSEGVVLCYIDKIT